MPLSRLRGPPNMKSGSREVEGQRIRGTYQWYRKLLPQGRNDVVQGVNERI
jgi:hypothetical protein